MKNVISTCAIFALSLTYASAQSQPQAGTHKKAVAQTSGKQQIKKEQPILSVGKKKQNVNPSTDSKKAKPELKTMSVVKPKAIELEVD